MLWLSHRFLRKVFWWQQAVILSVVGLIVSSQICSANTMGIEEGHTLIDFGSVSPKFSPYLFPLASQLVVHSSQSPWFLAVRSDSHFRDLHGTAKFPASSLEWRRHQETQASSWIPFGPLSQVVASSAYPTSEKGEVIGIDYRLHVTWDMLPTQTAANLAVQYTVGPTADLLASYVVPNPFDPKQDDTLQFGFYLPLSGLQTVWLKVLDGGGQVVYERQYQLEGDKWQRVTWSGVTLQGFPLDPGQYSYEISVDGRVIGAGTLLVDTIASGWGQLTGVVKDAETRTPVQFATVKIYNSSHRLCQTLKTDKGGEFETALAAPDRYFVQVSCPGYYPQESDWFSLESGQTISQEILLMHNNSLVIEELCVPERWCVGQPVEISFRIANPGTASVLRAVALLELPGWVALCSDQVWLERSSDAAPQPVSNELRFDGRWWRLELCSLAPGESVWVRLLGYGKIVPENAAGVVKIWSEGITEKEAVASAPVEKNIYLDLGIFHAMRPSNRLLVNSTWEIIRGSWRLGAYVNYPSEMPLHLVERHYLQREHGQVSETESGLFGISLAPMKLGDVDGRSAVGSGWIQYQDRFIFGAGERSLGPAPVGSDATATAGLHGLVQLSTGELWVSLGRPETMKRRQEWEINRVIREVTLSFAPLSIDSITVFRETAAGQRYPIDSSQYSVSLAQRRIVFFHPISPQNGRGETLVVEYDSVWQLDDGAQLFAVGADVDLGWHELFFHYFQVPQAGGSASDGSQAAVKNLGVKDAHNHWFTVEAEGELLQQDVQYRAAFSTIAGSLGKTLAGKYSALELDAAWMPSQAVTVQMENTLAGSHYRTFDPNRREPMQSHSEVAVHWALPNNITAQAKWGTAWWEGGNPSHREKSVGGGITWELTDLSTVRMLLERKSSAGGETKSLTAELDGEVGALTWQLSAELARIQDTQVSPITKSVGVDLDYQGTWSTVGLSYSRLQETAKDAHSLALKFHTASFGPVSFYTTSGWEWEGGLADGLQRFWKNDLKRHDSMRRTFDLGVTGNLGHGITWNTAITQKCGENGGCHPASGVNCHFTWDDPSGNGWRGKVILSRGWGTSFDTSLLEKHYSFATNLGITGWRKRREWTVQVEYTDPVSDLMPKMSAYVASGRYQAESSSARAVLVGTQLAWPWTNQTDFLWSLDCQVAEQDGLRVLTGELTGSILHRLNAKWSMRGDFSRFRQSPQNGQLTACAFGLYYRIAPDVTIGGGLSYLWNGKTNYVDKGLQPFLQFYCGAVPFDLLN